MNVRLALLEIISGKRKGVMAKMTRFILSIFSQIYRILITLRNWRFDRIVNLNGRCSAQTGSLVKYATIPVVSIGNLTTGGTGKTPLVIWLAERLLDFQHHPIIISRGYKALPTDRRSTNLEFNRKLTIGQNDEAIEIEQRLPHVPHLQSPNRYQAIKLGCQQFAAEVAILDDGFQHRQLHRDLDWVLIDATNPFGYDCLLPRGLLREPVASLRRADAVILTRCELASQHQRNQLLIKIGQYAPRIPIAQVVVEPSHWLGDANACLPLSELCGQELMAVCAIGNPDSFLATLEKSGFNICQKKIFTDHHQFSLADLSAIQEIAQANQAKAIVCTHKDWVKLHPLMQQVDANTAKTHSSSSPDVVEKAAFQPNNQATQIWPPFYALMTRLIWIENEELLMNQVTALMTQKGPPRNRPPA